MSSPLTDKYISYIADVRRYSPRTQEIYRTSLDGFFDWLGPADDASFLKVMTRQTVRSYEVHLLDSRGMSPRTVNLHLSILSGFCRYLMKQGLLKANPVKLVPRPKTEKRLPVFFRKESMEEYYRQTDYYVSEEFAGILAQTRDKESYRKMLYRVIVSVLHSTGIRRAELIGLDRGSVDFSRNVIRVRGKGDKMREIPLIPSLSEELSLYLTSVSFMICDAPSAETPLLLTPEGGRLYPEFVERAVKEEMGSVKGITGRKSPHVLRHTVASELLEDGTDLNSIKELLGHSSLAATQVYTHSTIERLKNVYINAHPRAKNGGNNGD